MVFCEKFAFFANFDVFHKLNHFSILYLASLKVIAKYKGNFISGFRPQNLTDRRKFKIAHAVEPSKSATGRNQNKTNSIRGGFVKIRGRNREFSFLNNLQLPLCNGILD